MIIPTLSVNITTEAILPAIAYGVVSFMNDGSMSTWGDSSGGPKKWFDPVGGNPGDIYWIKLTKNTGSVAPHRGAVNTILPMTSTNTWSWKQAIKGVRNINCTITIYSDALGTTQVSTCTVTGVIEASTLLKSL
jgi:hypothetical protein